MWPEALWQMLYLAGQAPQPHEVVIFPGNLNILRRPELRVTLATVDTGPSCPTRLPLFDDYRGLVQSILKELQVIPSESVVAFEDVTRATVYFSSRDIHDLVLSLPAEKRRYTKLMAATVKEPQEIWQCWVRDEGESVKWEKVRTYLSFYEISPSDSGEPFVFAIVQFTYRQRWEMRRLDVLVGGQPDFNPEVDKLYRVGSREYPRVGGT